MIREARINTQAVRETIDDARMYVIALFSESITDAEEEAEW